MRPHDGLAVPLALVGELSQLLGTESGVLNKSDTPIQVFPAVPGLTAWAADEGGERIVGC